MAIKGIPTEVLLALGRFSAAISGADAAAAIGRGLASREWPSSALPVGDGGLGTLAALAPALQLELVDPSLGIGDGVAVIEADGAGEATGQLIAAAVSAGARSVYVAVGGGATGAQAAGVAWAIRDAGGLGDAKLVVLCAGRIPAAGDERGFAGGLRAAVGGELVRGAPFVLDALGFDPRMHRARAVVAGGAAVDRGSLIGTAVSEAATRARQAGVPCHAVVGVNRLDRFDARILDLQLILAAGTIEELQDAGVALADAL